MSELRYGLKVGDKIRILRDNHPIFTKGVVVEIVESYYSEGFMRVGPDIPFKYYSGGFSEEGVSWERVSNPIPWDEAPEGATHIDPKDILSLVKWKRKNIKGTWEYYGEYWSKWYPSGNMPEYFIEIPPYYLNKQKEKEMSTQSFTKDDLRTGMRVTLRNGYVYQVLCDVSVANFLGSENALVREQDWISLNKYSQDFALCSNNAFSIVKVEQPTYAPCILRSNDYTTVWEREQPKPERETIEVMGKTYYKDEFMSRLDKLEETK